MTVVLVVLEVQGPRAGGAGADRLKGKVASKEKLNVKENFFCCMCFACQALGHTLNEFLEDLLGMSITSSSSQNKKIQLR